MEPLDCKIDGKVYGGFRPYQPHKRMPYTHRLVMVWAKENADYWQTDGKQESLELLLSVYRERHGEKAYIPYQVFAAETVQKLVNAESQPPRDRKRSS